MSAVLHWYLTSAGPEKVFHERRLKCIPIIYSIFGSPQRCSWQQVARRGLNRHWRVTRVLRRARRRHSFPLRSPRLCQLSRHNPRQQCPQSTLNPISPPGNFYGPMAKRISCLLRMEDGPIRMERILLIWVDSKWKATLISRYPISIARVQ